MNRRTVFLTLAVMMLIFVALTNGCKNKHPAEIIMCVDGNCEQTGVVVDSYPECVDVVKDYLIGAKQRYAASFEQYRIEIFCKEVK